MLRARDFPANFGDSRPCASSTRAIDASPRDERARSRVPRAARNRCNARRAALSNGKVVGVVCHEHVGSKRTWTPKEVDFVSSVSDSVALDMEAAALVDAEASLRKRDAQVAELRKWEAMGQLACGVAHDFRNVLVGEMAHATILIRDCRSPPERVSDAQAIRTWPNRGRSSPRI